MSLNAMNGKNFTQDPFRVKGFFHLTQLLFYTMYLKDIVKVKCHSHIAFQFEQTQYAFCAAMTNTHFQIEMEMETETEHQQCEIEKDFSHTKS